MLARRCEGALVLLIVAGGCRTKAPPSQEIPLEKTGAWSVAPGHDGAPGALIEPIEPDPERTAAGPVEERGGGPHGPATEARVSEGPARTAKAPPVASTGETEVRKRIAREAADGQRSAGKLRGSPVRRSRARAQASPKVLAAQELVAAPAPPAAAAAHATLRFRNDAGSAVRFVDARFIMDGAELPTALKEAERGKSYPVFSGDVSPGPHIVTVHLTYQGSKRAVFDYVSGYTFRVKAEEILTTDSERPASVTIVCGQKAGFNVPVEKSLVVTFEGRRAP